MLSRISTRAIASLLLISTLIPSALLSYPQKAVAQSSECAAKIAGALGASKATGMLTRVPTYVGSLVELSVSGSFITDCVLMPLAVQLAKAMLYNITVSTVNWINSGFQGNPGFVQDFKGLLTDTADQMIGEFIAKDLGAGFLCSPFSFQVKIALAQSYLPYRQKSACTFTQIAGNVGGFVQGNNSGGWDNWLQVTTVPQNNAYGAFVLAQDELSRKILDAQQVKEKYLDWGNGFRDWEVCTPAQPIESFGDDYDSASQSQEKVCEKRTPGAIVQSQLEQTLGSGIRQLEVASSINAIMDALANQVTKQIVTGAQGLLGSKRQGGGYGSVSYTAALSNSGANDPGLTTAINNSIDTSTASLAPFMASDAQYNAATGVIGSATGENGTSLATVIEPGTVAKGSSFTFMTAMTPGSNVTGADIDLTLMDSGSPVNFGSVFASLEIAGGTSNGMTSRPLQLGTPSQTWMASGLVEDKPFNVRLKGVVLRGAVPGTYEINVKATDMMTGELIAEYSQAFIVQ